MAVHGHCLCGAVQVSATGLSNEISACHCEMCTRWSGGIQMGIEVPESQAKVTGPVKVYASSAFAERAWCDVCGSSIWFRNTDAASEPYYELMPGLFNKAAGARLTRIVYADQAPEGYGLTGDVERVTKTEYEARFDHVEDGE